MEKFHWTMAVIGLALAFVCGSWSLLLIGAANVGLAVAFADDDGE